MGYYYSVRGWLELDEDFLGKVSETLEILRKEVSNDPILLTYLNGWCWKPQPLNWTKYVFYGADVQRNGVSLFEETLARLTCIPEIELNGYFKIDGEERETESVVIRVQENRIKKLMNDKAREKNL